MNNLSQACLAIARNTYLEAMRGKIVYISLAFTVFFLGFSLTLSQLTVGNASIVLMDLGLSSISILSIITTIAMGVVLIYKEVQLKTLYQILARPIPRWVFLWGKFLGLLSAVLTNLAIMSVFLCILLALWPDVVLSWKILVPLFTLVMELILLTSLSVCFSSMSSPLVGTIFVAGFTLISHFSWSLKDVLLPYLAETWQRDVAVWVFRLIPDFQQFQTAHVAVHDLPVDSMIFVWSSLYSLCYAGFFMILAGMVFRRKDLV